MSERLDDSERQGELQRQAQQERELLAALAAGPQAIMEQVSCVLALCANIAPAIPSSETAHSPSNDEARLSALADMADQLDQEQVQALYEAVQQLEHLETKLVNSVKLAISLPPQHFQSIIRSTWSQIDQLESIRARANVLILLTPLLTLAQDEPAAPAGLLEIVALAQAISNPEARIRSLVGLVPHLPMGMRIRVLHRILDEIDKLMNDSQRAAALFTLADHLIPEIETRALRSASSIQIPAERARAFTALARYPPIALQTNLRQDALSVIAAIRDEEERTDALIAFAPHLEYVTNSDHFPQFLEQALAIAIGIKRRHLRARVLVALAPHLTLDLQGEALAAVHSLSSERERAMLLAELAPTLPPNMLVASLAVAHSMAEQDSRVQALTVLAQYVPESAHERTVLDALEAAANLSNPYERISAMINLLPVLSPELKERAFTQSLDNVRLIKNENARTRALSSLASVLPKARLSQALEIAQAMSNAEQRLAALTTLAQFLDTETRSALAAELLDSIEHLPFEYKRAHAIGAIAALLPQDAIHKALKMAHEIEDPMDRLTALTPLISRLDLEQRRSLTAHCWQLLASVDNGYDAASALVNLAPLLPETATKDLIRRANMIIGSIMDDYDQASAITLLAPLVAVRGGSQGSLPDKYTALEKALNAILDVADLAQRLHLLSQCANLWTDISEVDQSYPLWQNMMQRLSTQSYPEAVLALSALVPVIRYLSGGETVRQLSAFFSTILTKEVAQSG